jgi:hypothetical protein
MEGPWFEASQGKNVSKTPLKKTSQEGWFMPGFLTTWEVEVGGS